MPLLLTGTVINDDVCKALCRDHLGCFRIEPVRSRHGARSVAVRRCNGKLPEGERRLIVEHEPGDMWAFSVMIIFDRPIRHERSDRPRPRTRGNDHVFPDH